MFFCYYEHMCEIFTYGEPSVPCQNGEQCSVCTKALMLLDAISPQGAMETQGLGSILIRTIAQDDNQYGFQITRGKITLLNPEPPIAILDYSLPRKLRSTEMTIG